MSKNLLLGLPIGSIASTALTTTFGLFHVNTFLEVYRLPLSSYATGNVIYAIINTANDVGGAWLVDSMAQQTSRSKLVGPIGFLFALSLLVPFFRFGQELLFTNNESSSSSSISSVREISLSPNLDFLHFVFSMSLYDTMYSFSSILFGSIFTDNHKLTKDMKIKIMATSKVSTIITSFIVAKIGLHFFDPSDLRPFRLFLLHLCLFACALFVTAQYIVERFNTAVPQHHFHTNNSSTSSNNNNCDIQPTNMIHDGKLIIQSNKIENGSTYNFLNNKTKVGKLNNNNNKRLKFKQIVRDFKKHKNFHHWILMEMFLECQTNFSSSFLKFFVDGLLLQSSPSFTRKQCDWILSSIAPMIQIVALISYIPIRRVGYHALYSYLFYFKFIMSLGMILFASPYHYKCIFVFIMLNNVLTGAVQSSGFHLAMADMVTEMKYIQSKEQRDNEPSLAGMFMGANALMCKPMDSFLPMVAAWGLSHATKRNKVVGVSTADGMTHNLSYMTSLFSGGNDDNFKWTLFYLLIGPSLLFSLLQLKAWRKYDLDKGKVDSMASELKESTNTTRLKYDYEL